MGEPSTKPALLYVHADALPGEALDAGDTDVVVTLHYVPLDPDRAGPDQPRGTASFRSAAPVAAAVAQSRPAAPAVWLPAAYGLAPTEAVVQHRRCIAESSNPT